MGKSQLSVFDVHGGDIPGHRRRLRHRVAIPIDFKADPEAAPIHHPLNKTAFPPIDNEAAPPWWSTRLVPWDGFQGRDRDRTTLRGPKPSEGLPLLS